MSSHKKILIPIFFLSLFNLVMAFLYYHTLSVIREKNTQTQTFISETASLEERINDVENTKKVLIISEADRASIDTHFIDRSDPTSFFEAIEKLGKSASTNLSLSSIDSTADNSKSLTVNFKANGTFENIYKLILLLENYTYEIIFKKVALNKNPNSSDGSGALWDTDFSIDLISIK